MLKLLHLLTLLLLRLCRSCARALVDIEVVAARAAASSHARRVVHSAVAGPADEPRSLLGAASGCTVLHQALAHDSLADVACHSSGRWFGVLSRGSRRCVLIREGLPVRVAHHLELRLPLLHVRRAVAHRGAAGIVEALCDRLLRLLLVWLLTSAASASTSLRRLRRDLLLLLRAYSGGHHRPFLLCDVDILTSDERSGCA